MVWFWWTFAVLGLLSVLVVVYSMYIRPWMRTQTQYPRVTAFLDWIEPIEIALYRKSETLLRARFKMISGAVLATALNLSGFDPVPLFPFLSERAAHWVGSFFGLLPLIISVSGWVDQKLRYDTKRPIDVVALPEAQKDIIPEVAISEVATQDAISAVNEVK